MNTAWEFMGGNILLLGRGIPEVIDGSDPTIARAEAVADYYDAFPSQVGRIVCSGGYSASLLPEQIPDIGGREANYMADALVQNGVPAQKIELEDQSVCTFTNFTETIEQGLFDESDLGMGPLIIGAGRAHYKRARLIGMQAFGFRSHMIRNIAPKGEGGAANYAKEVLVGVPATRLALLGARPANIEDTHRARERFERIVAGPNRRRNQRIAQKAA